MGLRAEDGHRARAGVEDVDALHEAHVEGVHLEQRDAGLGGLLGQAHVVQEHHDLLVPDAKTSPSFQSL